MSLTSQPPKKKIRTIGKVPARRGRTEGVVSFTWRRNLPPQRPRRLLRIARTVDWPFLAAVPRLLAYARQLLCTSVGCSAGGTHAPPPGMQPRLTNCTRSGRGAAAIAVVGGADDAPSLPPGWSSDGEGFGFRIKVECEGGGAVGFASGEDGAVCVCSED